jgi:predicted N-acetyltransferase YhbS
VIEVRPLEPADIVRADEVAYRSLTTMAAQYAPTAPPAAGRTPERIRFAHARIAHLQQTDPDGAWVAVDGSDVVGVALSLRRGPMWFLSLLAVATELQARGAGKALLEASLRTAAGADAAWILATPDPKALRRYAMAGFRPHPAYAALGRLDRALVPTGLAVRDGDVARDRDLAEDVVTGLRGAAYGPDIDAMVSVGAELLVAEQGAERGFCLCAPNDIFSLGATSPQVAQGLLWEALARLKGPEVEVFWLTADQQWAIDVVMAARLSLRPGPSSCRRSTLGPLSPYLPSGAYG